MKFISTALVVVGFLFNSNNFYAQDKSHRFEQLDVLEADEKRNIIIFLHTDWCKYCKAMQHMMLRDKEALNLLNDNYYFVSFNPEIDEDIIFRGKRYRFLKTGINTGIQQMVTIISDPPVYPSIIVMNSDFKIIHKQEGFLTSKQLIHVLQSFIYSR